MSDPSACYVIPAFFLFALLYFCLYTDEKALKCRVLIAKEC